jgi:hypothetical protein
LTRNPYVLALGALPVAAATVWGAASLFGVNPLGTGASGPPRRPEACQLITRAEAEQAVGEPLAACTAQQLPAQIVDLLGLSGTAVIGQFAPTGDPVLGATVSVRVYKPANDVQAAFTAFRQQIARWAQDQTGTIRITMREESGLGDAAFSGCGLTGTLTDLPQLKELNNLDCTKTATVVFRRRSIIVEIDIFALNGRVNALDQARGLAKLAVGFS